MTNSESTFKPNIFQKILIIFYVMVILAIGLFFVPFRHHDYNGNYTTVYDFIWSDNGSIDLYRIIIYIITLTGLFYFAYKYLNSKNNLEPSEYKRKAKIELYIFLFFIISIPVVFMFLYASNVRTISKRISIETKIREADSLITLKTQKKQNRLIFWNMSNDVFNDMYLYDNNIQNYWDFLTNSMSDKEWFDYFYTGFNKKRLEWIGVYNKEQLAIFIQNNVMNNEDRVEEGRVKIIYAEKTALEAEKDKTSLYDIKSSLTYFILFLIITLYVLRVFVQFVIGMFSDINKV